MPRRRRCFYGNWIKRYYIDPILGRNLLRMLDGLPAFNIIGVVLILLSPEKARFGDRWAGTRGVHAS